eukprot:COSAG02_NODE_3513_length_6629_cov_2.342266_6_plen_96_part_00
MVRGPIPLPYHATTLIPFARADSDGSDSFTLEDDQEDDLLNFLREENAAKKSQAAAAAPLPAKAAAVAVVGAGAPKAGVVTAAVVTATARQPSLA